MAKKPKAQYLANGEARKVYALRFADSEFRAIAKAADKETFSGYVRRAALDRAGYVAPVMAKAQAKMAPVVLAPASAAAPASKPKAPTPPKKRIKAAGRKARAAARGGKGKRPGEKRRAELAPKEPKPERGKKRKERAALRGKRGRPGPNRRFQLPPAVPRVFARKLSARRSKTEQTSDPVAKTILVGLLYAFAFPGGLTPREGSPAKLEMTTKKMLRIYIPFEQKNKDVTAEAIGGPAGRQFKGLWLMWNESRGDTAVTNSGWDDPAWVTIEFPHTHVRQAYEAAREILAPLLGASATVDWRPPEVIAEDFYAL